MANDTAKTQTTNIVPVQGIFEPLPPYAPVTLIGPAGTPFFAPTNPNLNGVSITNSAINSSVIGGITPAAGTFTNIATTTGTITAVPSGPTSIVNQAYVDAVAQGLSFKQPAAFTTSGDITLSGLSTQAGGDWPSTLTAGDRILVRDQTAQEDNGIYVAASGAWARAADANTYDEFLSAYLFVISGTIYSGSAWVCTNQPGGTLGVTPIVFIQFSNTALYNAGTGLTLTGFTFSITNTGVVAASYGSASDTLTATVNAQGQLTSLAASPIAILNTQVSGLGTMSTQNANTVAITGGNIDGTTIGGTTPAAVTGTTVTANTQFSGAGTGLTGTASALSIGGNAATATSATTATNLAGGATGSLPYQTGAGATTFLAAGTNGHVLTLAGGVPTWAAEQFQGDVVGPASATDNAIARFDTTSGKLIQNSAITLSDAGALQNVNEINFDTTPTSVVGGQGSLFWNSSEGTLDLVMRGGNTTQHIGEEVFYTARNATGSTINKATPVYASGVTAGSKRIEISPMIADGSIDELRFVGLTSENISNGVNGFVTDFGYIRNIDTSGAPYGQTWATGDIIYVSPTTAGYLTNVLPVAPNLKIVVALVIEADNNFGVLLVRPTVYPQIENLSNVNISTVTGGDLLVYDGTDARWENAAQSTITAGKATNLAGGSAGQVPYQSATDTTGFTATGTTGQVLTSQGTSAPTWTTITASIAVTDDTTTNAARYPLFADVTSGTLSTTYVSSTKYQFNPSTGVLTATSFSGAGTGLTGTASGLSIGGNAATATSATSATTATNLAGGANGSLPYQTGSGATTFLTAGTDGYVLTQASGVPTWAAAPQTGVTITDDTSTNATRYITFTDATTGTETGLDVSSTKLQFNPSTGTFSTTVVAAPTIQATGTSSSEGKLELYEDTDNGTNYVAIKAPAAIASNVTWTLPNADGTNGQVLSTNGSGTLSWETAGGGSGDVVGPASATDNAIARFDGTTGKLIQNSAVTIADSSGDITTGGVVLTANGSVSNPSFSASGDTNTGIFFPAADTIAFAEGGAEAMRIDSSANLQFNSGYGSVATAYGCRAWVNFDGTSNSANQTGTYSQTGTTVTVSITAHGYSTGQSAFLDFTSGTAVDGTYTVTVVDANTFTVTQASRTTSGNVTNRRNQIRASGNVSSITDNGTGDYTVNFTTAMPDANYAVSSTCPSQTGTDIRRYLMVHGTNGSATTQTTSALRLIHGFTNIPSDVTFGYVAIFR
jgi:hypothetical protein